jgi:eukaryotic-like serine/threonine-protein kinase
MMGSSRDRDPAVGPARFGKYDLLALLATGGMAEIWLARVSGMAGFEKLVVIKRLLDQLARDPEYVEMFLDEARINARLTHSNVVTVLELGQVEGKYFMAMEYVPGLSVQLVGKYATQRLNAVPQEVACGVVAQACAGLHYAHERSLPDGTPLHIVHRDISPQNLIVTFEGLVKVVDFGIARAAGRHTVTRTGFVKGKSSYMSPEQCLGQPLDRRSDVFALGIILFELATSRRLFKRANSYATLQAIAVAEVPPPRELNPKMDKAIEAVILRALARRREDRFDTAEEMQEALEYAMHKAHLRGARSDLEKFMEGTFAAEIDEQRRLLARAAAGERGLAQVSAVALEAAHEANQTYSSKSTEPSDRTEVDLLPPLGEDSGPAPFIDGDEIDEDALTDGHAPLADDFTADPTSADSPQAKRPEGGERPSVPSDIVTAPRGVPSHNPVQWSRPPLHYLLASVIVVVVAALVYFVLRR